MLVVCGPTAVGKSELADGLADRLSGALTSRVPVIAVDSMQVYRGLASITNQARRRPAGLVGVASISERWTVARHRAAADALIEDASGEGPGVAVLDAGTGMYLNALLLDVALAPEVPEGTRAEAERLAAGAENPRRAARQAELEMVGAPERGSIWDGSLRRETALVYIRPDREVLDAAIEKRSERIFATGREEAASVKAAVGRGDHVNPSVLEAIGVRELVQHLEGELTPEQARQRIAARTRRLARRQMRWFDKLAATLPGRHETARVAVVRTPHDPLIEHTMHDIIGP